jgi:hypothetical protein
MTHRIRERHASNVIGENPLIVTMRYRCSCAGNEVLSISMAIDVDCSEEQFLWTMKQMLLDVKYEVAQHLRPPEVKSNETS